MNAPSTPTPILSAIDSLFAIETDNTRWLKQAGPIARRLNEDAARDSQGDVL